ncbi:hypothetical protein CYMTET_34160 [Cymbomonas tetramitiformis]|uniref:Uncharacterized protein n=1 Tax=Cymbomonas tetramitiformis TaxID=36881 RepID=A0AAE0FBT9_9CHLO|nr:hypothetical protein CYMTET_34160 [Cymbomonas tetramitiformis]
MTTAEKSHLFRCIAVENAEVRQFGTGRNASKTEALRFQVVEDVAENPDHEGYWIRLDQWNRFRHDTYKDDRDAELPFIPDATRVSEAINTQASATVEPTAGRAPVYQHFVRACPDEKHTIASGDNKGKVVKVSLWKCTLCDSTRIFKVFSGSTGGLFKHLKRTHKAEHQAARISSTHSKVRVEEDGSITELYTFEEALLHHVRYVEHVILDLQHFHTSRSKHFRAYTAGLDKRYVPCSRDTSEKLVFVILGLMLELLDAIILKTQKELDDPFAGLQSDIWSPRDNKMAYSCSRLSMIVEHEGFFLDVCPLIDFHRFPENRHTGPALARNLVAMLLLRKLCLDSITLPTLDGASNNKKALKILKRKMRVRTTYPTSSFFSFHSRSFHSSVLHSERLEDAQRARGATVIKAALRQHTCRWSGALRMLRNNRQLEADIKMALTGDRSGVSEEQPAFVVASTAAAPTIAAPTAVAPTAAASDLGCTEGDSSAAESASESDGDSDEEQIEANESAGKHFSLQHRCLSGAEWKKNNMIESCLTPPHEVSEALQAHGGVGLDTQYMLSATLASTLKSDVVQVVSGSGENESWDIKHADVLPADLKQFRTETAKQVEKRMMVLDEDTLLALKFNPSIDVSANSKLFNDKQGKYELMEAVYSRQLRARGLYLLRNNMLAQHKMPASTPSALEPVVEVPSETGTETQEAPGSNVVRRVSGNKRRKVSILETAAADFAMVGVAPVQEEEPDMETVLQRRIQAEKEAFQAHSRAALLSGKFHTENGFDQLAFFRVHCEDIPIHTACFRADCASKKAASANVESVFSAATALLADFHAGSLSARMLSAYMIIRTNWVYPFLRPSVESVAKKYLQLHGKAAPEDSDSGESENDEN